MVMGGVGHLAKGEVDQQPPEVVAAPGGAARPRLRGEEAGKDALEHVRFAASVAEDPWVELAADDVAEPAREAGPELPRRLLPQGGVRGVQGVRSRSASRRRSCVSPLRRVGLGVDQEQHAEPERKNRRILRDRGSDGTSPGLG